MKYVFLAALILFCIDELYLIAHFAKIQDKQHLTSMIFTFIFFALSVTTIALFGIVIPYWIALLVLLTLFVHHFVGYRLNYYVSSDTFDRYLHGFGSFSFALFGYTLIGNLTEVGGSPLFRAIFIACLGVTLGVLFEIFEFIIDQKKFTYLQKGLSDTDWDLIFNLFGAILAGVAGCLFLF